MSSLDAHSVVRRSTVYVTTSASRVLHPSHHSTGCTTFKMGHPWHGNPYFRASTFDFLFLPPPRFCCVLPFGHSRTSPLFSPDHRSPCHPSFHLRASYVTPFQFFVYGRLGSMTSGFQCQRKSSPVTLASNPLPRAEISKFGHARWDMPLEENWRA